MKGYNKIAKIYDFLSTLVFFNCQHKSQKIFIQYLKNRDKILWIGGGEGKLLHAIAKKNLSLTIDYIDSSSEMIRLCKARAKMLEYISINYINADILDVKLKTAFYDVIITGFVLDHFSEKQLRIVFNNIDQSLKNEKLWMVSDFRSNPPYPFRYITKLMIYFFSQIIDLKIKKLSEIEPLFLNGYKTCLENFFFFSYIKSTVYKKNNRNDLI